jgi:hypothetical protein
MLVTGLPMWAKAAEAPSTSAPADFVGASSALIGVSSDDLQPSVPQDGVFLADQFYSLLQSGAPTAVSAMLSTYDQLVAQGKSPQAIGDALLTDGQGGPRTDATGAGARLTMLMWLLGGWYGGTETSLNKNSQNYIDSNYQDDFVVSGRAYKSGWIWSFAQSHPMGFSHFNFGAWADEPPPLSSYMTITT